MIKKYTVAFLLDKTNLWFESRLRNHQFKLKNKYTFKFFKNPNKIKNQNIVIPLSYTKILSKSFLKRNDLVINAHASKLPKDQGFAPLQYQILKNKNKVYISLIKMIKEVDAGPIYFQESFMLNGTELHDEIRKKQGDQILKILKKFLIKYPNVKPKKQRGKGNFNKRRSLKTSELNINKSIKQQFNHIRINDNENYPSFFNYKGQNYIMKVFKDDEKK